MHSILVGIKYIFDLGGKYNSRLNTNFFFVLFKRWREVLEKRENVWKIFELVIIPFVNLKEM